MRKTKTKAGQVARSRSAKSVGRPNTGKTIDRITVVNIKGPQVLRDWIDRISDETLISVAAITRDAWAVWAEKRNLEPPPKI